MVSTGGIPPMTRANSAGDCFPKPITYPHLQVLHLAQLAQHSPRSGPKRSIRSSLRWPGYLSTRHWTVRIILHRLRSNYCAIHTYCPATTFLSICITIVYISHLPGYFHCGIISPAPGTVPLFLQFALPHCQDPCPSRGKGRRINQWADRPMSGRIGALA
jgi:hypothetical protein